MFRRGVEHIDIPGYEGLYALTKDGKVYSYRRDDYLSLIHNRKDTSLYVKLYKDGTKKTYYVTQSKIDALFTKGEN